MDHQAKGKKTGKSRIPDHLRRRTLVSCDRCKKRRIRCLRSAGADASEACQSCLEVGANCESTLPRKTRIYGSVETLSIRYRVLDALIKGLFPQTDTNNIETLYAIAAAQEIILPKFDEQAVAEDVFSQTARQDVSLQPGAASGRSLPITSKDEHNYMSGNGADGKPSVVLEEKLVPMPQGPSHYIGPSSSFGFVLTVRHMVAEFNAALKNFHPDDERAKISSEFAGSNWSKALEPIVKDDSEESSEDNVDQEARGSRPFGMIPSRRTCASSLFHGSADGTALSNQQRKTTVLSLLPNREVTDAFVEAYFEKVHPNYPLFHRPTFQGRYGAIWSHPHTLVRDIEPGWICTIFMVLIFGVQASEERDPTQTIQIQRHYLELVQSSLHQIIGATTLTNVQVLLLLQLHQHNCTERNSAFVLLGCASRMAMALGMHREGTSGGFGRMEREVRKRVWWTTYLFEQNQCAILGRPCAIDDMEVNVTFPNEMMLDGGASVPLGYIEYSVRLMELLSEVRRKIYAAPTSPTQQGESPRIGMAIQFLLDLESWHQSLPQSLRLECLSHLPKHRRAVILLHVQFHQTQALVTRPFILRKVRVQLARKLGKHVRSQDLDKEEMDLSYACGTFSRKAALLLHQLLISGQFDGVAWLDAYYVYHAVFILSLDFLARPFDEEDTLEDLARKKAVRDVTNALHSVIICPTFTVLTQVSLQLAKIVGIFDAGPKKQEQPQNLRPYMKQQRGTNLYEYGAQRAPAEVEDVVNFWFQREPVDLPWDLKGFFGTEGYVDDAQSADIGQNAAPFPLTMCGTYSNQLPGISNNDDLSDPLPHHTAYTHWGTFDMPFAQPSQDGNMSRDPGRSIQ